MRDVSIRIGNRDLRSYLKLYTSLDAKKLASYLDGSASAKNGKVDEESDPEAEVDGGETEGEEKMDEETLVQRMMVLKMNGRSLVQNESLGPSPRLLDGVIQNTSDVNFVINQVRPLSLDKT